MFTKSISYGEKSFSFLFNAKDFFAKTFFASFILSLVAILPLGCKKIAENEKSVTEALPEKSVSEQTEQCFVFRNGGLQVCSDISALPKQDFYPWTEVENVNGMVLLDTPLFLINKQGVLSFTEFADGIKPVLKPFPPAIEALTAQDFFLAGNALLFRTYKNSLFTDVSPSAAENPAPFLFKYNPVTETFSEAVTSADVGLPQNAQCTHLQKYRNEYLASFKTENDAQVDFTFFSCDTPNDLLAHRLHSISKGKFQDAAVPEEIEPTGKYTEPIKKLLAFFAKEVFSEATAKVRVAVHSVGGESKTIFAFSTKSKNSEQQNEADIQGVFDAKSNRLQILLPEGTLCSIVEKDSVPIMTKYELPKLPEGFVYTYFSVETFWNKTSLDTVIIAFWEERNFFRIGRAGVITMPAKGLEPLRSCPQ